jgi:hypothetical protein
VGYRYSGKADWREKHQRYLRELRMPLVAYKAVMEEYPLALDQCIERVKQLSWKAQTRLHKRGWHLTARGVMKPKVIVALAREMAGFVWAMLHLVPVPKEQLPVGLVLRRA